MFLSVSSSFAQDDPVSPGRAREVLRMGIDLHKRGEYETADGYFKFANQAKPNLNQAEQADLATFSGQNAVALKSRLDGAAQLKQATDALQKGKTQEAATLLKALDANQYLSSANQKQVAELNQMLAASAGGPQPATDAKSLLSAGRAALQKGNLDLAESYAAKAESAGGISNLQKLWSDSPSKLRADIQSAKAKLPSNPTAPAQVAKAEPESKSWLPSLPTFFGKSEKQKEEAASDRRVDEKIARDCVRDGYIFLQKNDLEKAVFMANRAKDLSSTWGPNEATPDQLLQEIQRRVGGPMPIAAVAEPKPVEAKPIEMPSTNDPHVLLKFGRTLLEKKQYEDADKVCGKVLTMNGRWGLWEDTPEKLRRDIQRAKMYSEREDSFKVMADARKLFAQGNLEEAERKAYKAQQMHGPYGVFDFGDRPSKLLEEIQQAKQAKGLTNPTNKANPPQTAQAAPKSVEQVGVDFNTNPPTKTGFPTTGVPAGIQSANKNRAIVMVREARDLERQGQFMEARQKATEARMLKAIFAPEEDSPDAVLLSVSAKSERQVQAMLQQVAQQVVVPSDPQRFDKAMRQLGEARALAQSFELDLSRIDQTANYVQQVAAGARPLSPVSTFTSVTDLDIPTGDPEQDRLRSIGRQKLRDAQTALNEGHTAQARKMAEDIYDAKYGVQTQVRALLHSIANEEYNQRCLAASRNFMVAVDAYNQRDYRKAQVLFGQVDAQMLPEQYQARLRDIMGTREMQPDTIVQVGGQVQLKGSPFTHTEPGIEPKVPAEDNLLADQKAREIVQFQQLRQRWVQTQSTAHELFKNKQQEQAMATLNNYLEQVNEAQFSAVKANELRRPVEAKIQQYRTLIAAAKWEKTEDGYRFPYGKHDEGASIAERKKLQAKVVEMMTEAHELFNKNKLKESIEIAKKVREIDPENVAALAMERIALTRLRQLEWNDGEHQNEEFNYKVLPHTTAPPGMADRDIIFDKQYAGKRKVDNGAIRSNLQDPKERAIEYRLLQPLSLNFKDMPLKDAIREVGLLSNVQIVPDLGPLTRARINLDAPLSVSVQDVDMKAALNIMLKPLQLTYIIEDQVLKITTEDRIPARIVRVVYPVADLVAVPEDHPLPDVFNITEMIRRVISPGANMPSFTPPPSYQYNPGSPVSSHSSGLGGAFGTSPGSGSNGMMPPPTVEKKHEMGLVLVDLIKNVVQREKWDNLGGPGTVHYTPFGMALVVNQVLDVQKDVEELLASLRRLQDLQVSVELRAVLVSESFFERIGVDFNMNILTPNGPGKAALSAGNTATASANNTLTGYTGAGTLTPDLNIPILNNTFALTQPQFGGYQPGAGLSLGLAFLSDIQVFMFLEAVSGDQRAHVMQAPKLTVYNGQTAFITANVARPFMSGVTPILAPNGLPVLIPQMTVYPLGLGMQVQPVVSPDRRFVRLNITPILTSGFIDPAGQIIIPVPSFPANGIAPLFNTGNIQPPLPTTPLQVTNGLQFNPLVANVNIVNTTVNVPDGGTVLMGGFKFLAEQRSEYGPPVLSNIPYLSRLFRNVGWSRDSSTLLYLVTARIIMVEEEEQIFLRQIPAIPRE
jgi:type II secretory pathway component GspD/PulD (secretin)